MTNDLASRGAFKPQAVPCVLGRDAQELLARENLRAGFQTHG